MLIRVIFLLAVAHVVFCGSTLAGNPRVFPKEQTFTVKVEQPQDIKEFDNSSAIGHRQFDDSVNRHDQLRPRAIDSRKGKNGKFETEKGLENDCAMYQDPHVYETDDEEEDADDVYEDACIFESDDEENDYDEKEDEENEEISKGRYIHETDDEEEENSKKNVDETDDEDEDTNNLKDKYVHVYESEVGQDNHYHDNLKVKSFSSRQNDFTIYSNSQEVSFLNNNGLQLTMTKRHDNPFMGSDFPIKYGKIEAEFKSAPGKGIISSIYLQGEDLDEIDIIETFGSFPQTYQTNYFVKGDVTQYHRGVYHISHVPMHSQYQKIAVEWNAERVAWYFNNHLVREIHKGNPDGFPSSPMYLKISLWAGGDAENESGTIEWAGGITDYNQLPVSMFVKNLYIHDYSTGTEYFYGDRGRVGKRDQPDYDHRFKPELINTNTSMFPQLPLLKNYTQDTSDGVQLPKSCSLLFLVFAYELVLVWFLL